MKKRLYIISLIILLSAGRLSALTVTVNFDNGGPIDKELKALIEPIISAKIGKYDSMPELARGFGNANTYASHDATLRGYQGYDIFAIAAGSMVSVQAPSDDPLFFKKLQDELNAGDIYAGVGGNPAVVQAGLNLGFILDGLYLSFKFGKFSYNVDQSKYKIDYQSNLLGVLVNYQLINQKSILSRALLWRGISLESGFIYSNNTVSFYKELTSQTISGATYTATVDPSINLVLDTKSYIVPVELYTSLRLLYILNIGVGGGIDYVPSGKTSFKIESAGPITIVSPLPVAGLKGTASIQASTKDIKPDKIRTKMMANVGLGIGPVFIDMPASYYFADNGYSLGLSAGLAW